MPVDAPNLGLRPTFLCRLEAKRPGRLKTPLDPAGVPMLPGQSPRQPGSKAPQPLLAIPQRGANAIPAHLVARFFSAEIRSIPPIIGIALTSRGPWGNNGLSLQGFPQVPGAPFPVAVQWFPIILEARPQSTKNRPRSFPANGTIKSGSPYQFPTFLTESRQGVAHSAQRNAGKLGKLRGVKLDPDRASGSGCPSATPSGKTLPDIGGRCCKFCLHRLGAGARIPLSQAILGRTGLKPSARKGGGFCFEGEIS